MGGRRRAEKLEWCKQVGLPGGRHGGTEGGRELAVRCSTVQCSTVQCSSSKRASCGLGRGCCSDRVCVRGSDNELSDAADCDDQECTQRSAVQTGADRSGAGVVLSMSPLLLVVS